MGMVGSRFGAAITQVFTCWRYWALADPDDRDQETHGELANNNRLSQLGQMVGFPQKSQH